MDGLEVVGDVLRVGGQVVQRVGYRPHRLNRADAGLINASPFTPRGVRPPCRSSCRFRWRWFWSRKASRSHCEMACY
jgi:hypothetical protein